MFVMRIFLLIFDIISIFKKKKKKANKILQVIPAHIYLYSFENNTQKYHVIRKMKNNNYVYDP